jgi:RecJ-like exonuclease
MAYLDELFSKKDCVACGGKGTLSNGYYRCLTCDGLGYSYVSTPKGPSEEYPDNLKLKANSEGASWVCLCGSDNEDIETLYSSHETTWDEVKCEECGRVYQVEKTYRLELTITLEGKTVAEGTY